MVVPGGLSGSLSSSSSITGSSVSGSFIGDANLTVDLDTSASGYVILTGIGGPVDGMTMKGNVTGSYTSSFDGAVTHSFVSASFIDGVFFASSFFAEYNGWDLTAGEITGSWNDSHIILSSVTGSWNGGSNTYFDIVGPYIFGTILGTYITGSVSGSVTGSLSGRFMNGEPFEGSILNATVTGSYLNASTEYTSSVTMSANVLQPVDTGSSFNVVVQNLRDKYKASNIVRVNIFGREELPLKNFERKTQFSQYLTAKYLPTSSYYSIKDNETEQILIDFDNYTKISCDENGNYFLLDTTGLPQERYFRILIKVDDGTIVQSFDHDSVFKIVR